ncbi:hypothetical protein D1B31_18185 [Neobacillus notoginsengisoli]|uniref:Uncharacterized protein n=1 Tax=Neobacillus notoginsengisoli TaxID=1578198 RepID=A0A417YPX6_9BACI|nr:hypothetical protein [Neobacillus notoginsengisoli]RHW36018.1 hypothetical protein D1B31_18185 [Neobacillus notoginsengisoli]
MNSEEKIGKTQEIDKLEKVLCNTKEQDLFVELEAIKLLSLYPSENKAKNTLMKLTYNKIAK